MFTAFKIRMVNQNSNSRSARKHWHLIIYHLIYPNAANTWASFTIVLISHKPRLGCVCHAQYEARSLSLSCSLYRSLYFYCVLWGNEWTCKGLLIVYLQKHVYYVFLLNQLIIIIIIPIGWRTVALYDISCMDDVPVKQCMHPLLLWYFYTASSSTQSSPPPVSTSRMFPGNNDSGHRLWDLWLPVL